MSFILIASFSSCYTYSAGEFIKTEKTVHTEQQVSSTQDLQVTFPRKNDPTLSLRLVKNPVHPVTYVDKYTELREANKGTGWTLLLLGGAAGYAALKMDSVATSDKNVRTGLIVGSLVFLYYGIDLITKEGKSRTGSLIDGGSTTSAEMGNPIPIQFSQLSVTVAGKTKTFQTNWNGFASISLPYDFGFDRFLKPEPLSVSIICQNPTVFKAITLNPTDWTIAYFQVAADQGWIYENPNPRSQKLGQYKKGEILAIEDEPQRNWIRIRKGQIAGWIPTLAGSRFWSVREIR
ncbi:MAG TPA: SH3 domain-containing protein [Candidatus Hodarchaeales archaeon]|nr:SH3 domain-containing protein [Candidatus Hodarchaeales archaeon]